ncbi:class D beta-lactamase [Marinimicrobium alkaliphilum]|uniref:class D beta-lactamase n=1 Tax=Marinimicrobium alkaliphilum TaxID=2202654 RepID=UPI0018E0C16A|nr:class D beta-lactamase [Marinimicrobium alkaliphilum]
MTKKRVKRIIATVCLMAATTGLAAEWTDSRDVEALFSDAGVSGTFVLYDVAENRFVGFDQARAETRYIPASTFKVPHTLIGLAEGVVNDVDQVLPYGGEPQRFSSWERDMSLRDALPISNVPIYKGLASEITLNRMAENLALMNYGNGEIGAVVDDFWLVGPLTVSAVEQAVFLADLAQNELPYPANLQEQVRDITLIEQGDDWALHAKTGWTNAPDPNIGWWIGWVVKQGRVYSFAVNIDIVDASDAEKRIPLGRESLIALGVL